MNRRPLLALSFLALCLFLAAGARADVKLPAILSDHMVLQQDVPVRIWGQADPGEAVTVQFQGQKLSTMADSDGKWAVFLKPLKAGGPAEMTVAGQYTIVIHDVLVGEVWVGSGQSNMELVMTRVNNAEQEIAQADFPQIRLFTVKRTVADKPADDVVGSWQLCSPESVKPFSAVGYFFSRELYQKLRVPVGFIHSSWGGTPAQSWTSRPALESEPALQFILDDWQKVLADYPAAREKFDKNLEAWKQASAAAKAAGTPEPRRPTAPPGPGHQNTPAGLYNGMIAPLTAYAVRGVTWYQGESNATVKHAYPYRRLFRLMIEDWRRAWGEGAFPFLFVQLANYKSNQYWPVLRESQTEALALRNTGMAVIIDIGESADIHPRNKQDVGRRLALAARANVYGENIEYSGPMFRQLTREGSQLCAWFEHAAGLEAKGGGSLAGFTIAGQDGNFVSAEARVDGQSVVLSAPDVKDPVAVRYAWADDPLSNLVNSVGLPASPFRASL